MTNPDGTGQTVDNGTGSETEPEEKPEPTPSPKRKTTGRQTTGRASAGGSAPRQRRTPETGGVDTFLKTAEPSPAGAAGGADHRVAELLQSMAASSDRVRTVGELVGHLAAVAAVLESARPEEIAAVGAGEELKRRWAEVAQRLADTGELTRSPGERIRAVELYKGIVKKFEGPVR